MQSNCFNYLSTFQNVFSVQLNLISLSKDQNDWQKHEDVNDKHVWKIFHSTYMLWCIITLQYIQSLSLYQMFLHSYILIFFNRLNSMFLQMQLECFLLQWIMMLISLSISSALLTSLICSDFAELISLLSFLKLSMLVFSFFEFMITSSSSILSDSMSRLISLTANAHFLNN